MTENDFVVRVLEVAGVKPALLAMRLPHKSKSVCFEKDKKLSQKLCNAGNDHSKHLRLIDVWLEITAPRYWWQEFDTYRIGIDKVSESTMHTLQKDDLSEAFSSDTNIVSINYVNELIRNGSSLQKIKCNLPEGFLQKRICKCSFQALYSVYQARKNHKLEEWKKLCMAIENIDYFAELTGIKKGN